jgi:hypothetical protein
VQHDGARRRCLVARLFHAAASTIFKRDFAAKQRIDTEIRGCAEARSPRAELFQRMGPMIRREPAESVRRRLLAATADAVREDYISLVIASIDLINNSLMPNIRK